MIGTIVGIIPVAMLATLPSLRVLVLFFLASVVVLAVNRRTFGKWASGVLLGTAIATSHGHTLLSSRVSPNCEQLKLQLVGVVASLPILSASRFGKSRQRFRLEVASIEPKSCAGPKSILLSYYGPQQILPGQNWQFDAKLKRPWGLVNPGGFNVQSWYAQEGIDAVGTAVAQTESRVGRASDLRYKHHEVRSAVSSRMSSTGLDPQSLGILKALTVADKSGIDDQLWQLFQVFGLNHLLVISGLHIGLVASLGFGLGNLAAKVFSVCGYQRYVLLLPYVLAALFAIAYAALAGFTLSTNRAVVMLCTFLVASVFSRRSSSWNALLMAAFVLTVSNPLQILGSGFWLSFGAVAWLLWLTIWMPSTGLLVRLIYVHLGMSVVMIPLGGFWFGGASVISGLANLFMIPLVGFFVVPLSLLAASVHYFYSDLGNVLFQMAAWPLDLLLPLAERFMEHAHKALYHPFYPSLLSVLLALFGLGLLVAQAIPRSLSLCLILCGPLLFSRGAHQLAEEHLATLTVMDVGQGTAIVFRDGERSLVYDTGGGDPLGRNLAQSELIPYLGRENVEALETLVISHGDNDHSAGANDLLSTFAVGQYFSGAAMGKAAGNTSIGCVAGKAWQWSSSIQFQFLSPSIEQGLSSNNGSCVLQITVGEMRILLTGDIDAKREKVLVKYWRNQLHSHWMLAPHHGSKSSSSRLWLKYVHADTVVFSSGYRNAFGHPHPDVLERAENGNTTLYTTATDGAVEFVLGPTGIAAVTRYRKDQPRYWH
ncbi:MAG: competence protein ComEC [Bacteroidia bacterium]|jgi:competence protein ComEC